MCTIPPRIITIISSDIIEVSLLGEELDDRIRYAENKFVCRKFEVRDINTLDQSVRYLCSDGYNI